MKRIRTKKSDEWLSKALETQRQCEERWLRDFGDRPVVNYDTGQYLGTAREVLERHRRNRKG